MRPNLTSIEKVLARIEEISKKYAPEQERSLAAGPSQRFVDVLDSIDKEKSDITSAGKGRIGDDALKARIADYAEQYNIDEELIRAVIQVESGWKSDAVSGKGAMGLMQLMPRTASMLGVEDPFDPEQNVEGGIKYLSQLTDKYQGDVEMALAAYNAGPSRVDSAKGIPFPETDRYVKNVMALYHRYREES